MVPPVAATLDLLLGLNEVERKNSPTELFYSGDIGILENPARVSIVGSRRASPEGERRAAKLAKILASNNVVVVSGLAEGIDTAAHKGTIAAGGKTLAVIGTPIDKVYPKKNASLQAEIAANHLLVSQFPHGHPTLPQNFFRRNKTMALLSCATVIVEAGEASGSLSQGWEALRLGRMLYIMESVVKSGDLKWPAEMLGYGAEVLTESSLEGLLENLPTYAFLDDCGLHI